MSRSDSPVRSPSGSGQGSRVNGLACWTAPWFQGSRAGLTARPGGRAAGVLDLIPLGLSLVGRDRTAGACPGCRLGRELRGLGLLLLLLAGGEVFIPRQLVGVVQNRRKRRRRARALERL